MTPTPLAWAIFTDEGLIRIWSTARTDLTAVAEATGKEPTPLYAPPVAQTEQPVAFRILRRNHDGIWTTDGRAWVDGVPDADMLGDIAERSDQWRLEYSYAAPIARAGLGVTRLDGCLERLARPQAADDGVAMVADQLAQLRGQHLLARLRDQLALGVERQVYALPGELPEQSQAAADVLAERRRQVEAKGWTPSHDDLYCAAELPRAAAAYILNGANDEAPVIWPFAPKWWKPRDARSNYVRAAALILAEIERLDRQPTGSPEGLLRSAQGGAE